MSMPGSTARRSLPHPQLPANRRRECTASETVTELQVTPDAVGTSVGSELPIDLASHAGQREGQGPGMKVLNCRTVLMDVLFSVAKI